jgi:menaquinone-dependent protoporphyrinogen oxidase
MDDMKMKKSLLIVERGKGPVLTRRGFMDKAGWGAMGLAGATLLGAPPARAAKSDPMVEFIRTSCGDDNKGPRILVGYASLCGTTGGVAEAIGKRLCKAGARVDVKLMKDVMDPSEYDGFVLGSAIQGGRWLPAGIRFVGRHKEVLKEAPVAYFITCLAMSEDTAASRKLAETYVKHPLRKARKVEPVGLGTFAGAVDYARLPKRYHAIMKRIVAEECDYRNWDAIGAWAESIAPALLK